MKRLRRPSTIEFLVGFLFVTACVFGVAMQRASQVEPLAPRARFDDTSPLGGKGLRLLLARLGYKVQRVNTPLQAVPKDARVWMILDPQTRFSQRENRDLMRWIRNGGTLILACAPRDDARLLQADGGELSSTRLAKQLDISPSDSFTPPFLPLPKMQPLDKNAPAIYWTGVKNATSSGDTLRVGRAALELAGNTGGSQLSRIDVGKGRVFALPDALLFTNYALAKPDNAVLVSNLVRVHAASGAVYFDERNHRDANDKLVAATRILNWFDYLWRAPLRYAMLQVLFAGVLWWAFAARRLGAPVPLPAQQPVTRASQFALGMGSLFRKANRPQAAARVLGESFRREVARRTGLPLDAEDQLLAERASQKTGLPAAMIDRLLLRAQAPDDRESHILSDTQEMEIVLRALRGEQNPERQ